MNSTAPASWPIQLNRILTGFWAALHMQQAAWAAVLAFVHIFDAGHLQLRPSRPDHPAFLDRTWQVVKLLDDDVKPVLGSFFAA